ncbi:MAG: hypothetical protein RIQ93_1173 [Verrucomicrobiota bacterium]
MTTLRAVLGLIIAIPFLLLGSLSAMEPPAGFSLLLHGSDLAGWRGAETVDPRPFNELPAIERAGLIAGWTATLTQKGASGKAHWRIEKGELVNDGAGGSAATEIEFGDFDLRAEYRLAAGASSRLYLRAVPALQLEADPAPGKTDASVGDGFWAGDPGVRAVPLAVVGGNAGEWRRLRIVLLGSRTSVWLDDRLVVDHAILANPFELKPPSTPLRPILPRGPLQWRGHGGEMRWRNLCIRPIGGDEAGQLLAARGAAGFKKIFNGRDLAGWAGDVDGAEVNDGAIVWRPAKRGTLYWNETLANFQVRVAFKLPPGGNNGLAIRYPGKGNAAFDGMAEVQVLDDNYEKVRGKIDPRQAHGSAAEMVAAARGYQRPIGEWNFEEVTVEGSRLKVELNGTVILDTDLANIGPANYNRGLAHPGKDRTEGFFGFAGHNDPVAFKDIFIRPF